MPHGAGARANLSPRESARPQNRSDSLLVSLAAVGPRLLDDVGQHIFGCYIYPIHQVGLDDGTPWVFNQPRRLLIARRRVQVWPVKPPSHAAPVAIHGLSEELVPLPCKPIDVYPGATPDGPEPPPARLIAEVIVVIH